MGFGAMIVSAGLLTAGGPGEETSGFEAACKSACVFSQQAVAMHISAIEAQCERRCAGDQALPLAIDRAGLKAHLGERVRVRGWLSVEEKKTPPAPAEGARDTVASPPRRIFVTLGDGTRLELLSGPGLEHPELGQRFGKFVELAGTLDSLPSNLSFVSGVAEAPVPAAPKPAPAKGS